MKIAFVNNTFEPFAVGGAEMSMLARAKGLKARGHAVKVFTLAADGAATERDVGGVDVEYVTGRWAAASPFHTDRSKLQKLMWHVGPEWIPGGATDLAGQIAAFQPDVVNIANLPGVGFANIRTLQAAGIRVVMTIADFAPLCAGTTMLRGGKQCESRCGQCRIVGGPRLSRFLGADQFVFISDFMRQSYIKALPQHAHRFERAPVIHNGLDEKFLAADSETPCASASGANGPLRIGYIGQLNPNKGVEALLQCFAGTPFRQPATLTVAGKGDSAYEAQLKQSVSGRDDVDFVGWANPMAFFQTVDLVVVPSIWNEPLGRVPYEANYFGRPALVANRGGLPELIAPGVNGAVFDPENLQDFRACLLDWADQLTQRRSEIAEASRRHAIDRHHPGSIAARYEQVFSVQDVSPAEIPC
ncbi:MAG: glycosyltransferase [Pseudomonadota bacterium]